MKSCKVKNPCKICSQTVNNRNGLQCKGACKKWSHFKCLDYTPGKICDIKAGLIKITCPCPDCTITEPKEELKPPLNCIIEGCPATKPPCEAPDKSNKQNTPCPASDPTPARPECPKQLPPPIAAPKCSTSPGKSCPPPKIPPPRCPNARISASPPGEVTTARKPFPSCPTHCPKRSHENLGTDKCLSPQRSRSCSLDSSSSSHSEKSCVGIPRCCSSDSALLNAQDQKMLHNAIEQMCDTMGQLSCQLKDFMCKMLNAFQNSKQTRK